MRLIVIGIVISLFVFILMQEHIRTKEEGEISPQYKKEVLQLVDEFPELTKLVAHLKDDNVFSQNDLDEVRAEYKRLVDKKVKSSLDQVSDNFNNIGKN